MKLMHMSAGSMRFSKERKSSIKSHKTKSCAGKKRHGEVGGTAGANKAFEFTHTHAHKAYAFLR